MHFDAWWAGTGVLMNAIKMFKLYWRIHHAYICIYIHTLCIWWSLWRLPKSFEKECFRWLLLDQGIPLTVSTKLNWHCQSANTVWSQRTKGFAILPTKWVYRVLSIYVSSANTLGFTKFWLHFDKSKPQIKSNRTYLRVRSFFIYILDIVECDLLSGKGVDCCGVLNEFTNLSLLE